MNQHVEANPDAENCRGENCRGSHIDLHFHDGNGIKRELPMSGDQVQLSESKHASRLLAAGAIIVAAIMWGSALALPVWETRSDHTGAWSVVPGILPALIGFLGLVVLCPAWFANLLLIPMCVTIFKAPRAGFWLSAAAFAIAASAYRMPAIYGDNDEAVIVMRRIGFYLWLSSFWVIALGHALGANWARSSGSLACWATLVLMLLAVLGLEYAFPVGVSPLEATTKYPDDLTALTNALAQNPPQADKDKTLHWVLVQELDSHPDKAAFPRIQQLIAAGANVNQADRNGTTPLMQAVTRHADSMVRLLIQAGANVNARDWRGKTVLDIAQESGSSPQCQQLLVNSGARRSIEPKQH